MTELELRLAASRLTLLVRMTEYVRCAELYVERYGNYQCGYDVDTDETIVIQHDQIAYYAKCIAMFQEELDRLE